ncbi:ABC transporter permease [Streptomyces sp. NPDC005438]|uniref:ABC transporter permease n=1 Tax=Streptomyces sp. NPDC005438 TaxID=3156880 RepID=UPI0033B9F3F6
MTTTPTVTGAPAPRAQLLTDSWIMTVRSVRLTLRSPTALGTATLLPLLLLMLMTASFGALIDDNGSYRGYVDESLPLFAVMGIAFSALATGTAAHTDLQTGFDARLRTLPMARSAPLTGRILGDAARNLASLLIVTLVGFVMGFRFDTGPLSVLGYFLLPLLFGSALAWLVVALAVRARSAESVGASMNAVFLLLSFLSTGFVPLRDLPGWAQPLAEVNPVSCVVETMRGFAHSGPVAEPLLESLAWILGLTLVFASLAVRGYRRRGPR